MPKKTVSFRRATTASRMLVRQLLKNGFRISEREVQELAARMYGFANWPDLRATVARQHPDLFDPLLLPRPLKQSRARQTAVLVEWGVRPDIAEQISSDFEIASNGRRVRRRSLPPANLLPRHSSYGEASGGAHGHD